MSDGMRVWIDGRALTADEARVSPLDRGFQYGDGVFETLRAERGMIFFLDMHLARMRRGLDALGIELPEAELRATEGLGAVIELLGPERVLSLKVIVTRGTGPGGPTSVGEFAPTVVVLGSRADAERPASLRAVTTGICRNERSPLATIKSLNCGEMLLARAEAERKGVDEGLVLNTQGRLAEASAANVFLVKDGRIVTPPESEGCLPGIIRGEVLSCARELGIDSASEPVPAGDVRSAEEVFLTNSRIGVVPLVELDGEPAGSGAAGPVTKSLRGALRKAEFASGEEV